MALGTFRGRSRTLRQSEASSSPAQKHADARPRKNSGRHEPSANLPQDSARPKTAEQQQRHMQDANPGFDFQIPATPSNAMTSPTSPIISPTDGLIGVALGSPRMVEVPMAMSQEQQFERPPEVPVRPSLQRKPSKWKKIGGLFKAKSALSAPVPNQPFYHVQPTPEWPMPASAVSINRRQPILEESPNLDEKPILEEEPKPGDVHKKADPRPDDQPSPIEAWPSLELEPTPEPMALKHEQTAAINEPSQTVNASSNFMPLLQIDIPDIQLERYSVMFGGVLQKNRPPSLNRRSKTLNDADTDEAKVSCSCLLTVIRLTTCLSNRRLRRQKWFLLVEGRPHQRVHGLILRTSHCFLPPKSARLRRSWDRRTYPVALAHYTSLRHHQPSLIERMCLRIRAISFSWCTVPRPRTSNRVPCHRSYQQHLSAPRTKDSSCRNSSRCAATLMSESPNGRSSTRSPQPPASLCLPSLLPSRGRRLLPP